MSLTIAGLRTTSRVHRVLHVQVRCASTGARQGTAQEVDKMLGDQKKQARMRPGMDPTQQPLALFQPIVDPPFSLGRFWDAGLRETFWYGWARFLRYYQTRQALKSIEFIDHTRDDMSRPDRAKVFFQRQNVQYRARDLIQHTFTQYLAYNKAQASGDLGMLRSAASGNAYEIARKRIAERPAGDSLDWQLMRVAEKPKLRSAVIGQITQTVYASQIIVAFDTEQALTYKPKGRVAQVRSSRVKEFYVFQRLLPGYGNAWKLRDQIHETDPFAELKVKRLAASKEVEAKRLEASKAKAIK